MNDPYECGCDECEACLAEAARLRLVILDAVRSGKVTEDQILNAVVKYTDRPETVAMVEDYKLQREEDEEEEP